MAIGIICLTYLPWAVGQGLLLGNFGYLDHLAGSYAPFNLPRRALRHASQGSHVVCDERLAVALFLSMVARKNLGRWQENKLAPQMAHVLTHPMHSAKSITGPQSRSK
jgi:hypothetical protein